MNIVVPAASDAIITKLPVMVYVHGGSLLYGGANLPIFDAVNLVSQSLELSMPILCVNFNYRVGLGGFLASQSIKRELEQDGFTGCGNFGFTDQQVAFQWVQKYIHHFGGDATQVTAVGESAGGISISHQMCAASPPVFHRAVCMSGLSVSIPAWSMDQHEELFIATCRHFGIDPADQCALEKLRDVPQQKLADATPIIQGVLSGTGNACLDDWFYAKNPLEIHPSPSWVQEFMLGDTYHEGVIFHLNIADDSYEFIKHTMLQHIHDEEAVTQILTDYGITPGLSQDELVQRIEHMCGDAVFKIPNYATAKLCFEEKPDSTFCYHFDQLSRIKNQFEGTAYHAHELLYLFRNLENEFSAEEVAMAKDFAAFWIRFVCGKDPWAIKKTGSTVKSRQWKVWGPSCQQSLKCEIEDEEVRNYLRMERILAMGDGKTWTKWLMAVDALVNKRMRMGKNV